ncbi:integral membrane protein [Staphylococcus muscae]|uniref:Integral membrane protein n=2 Tax=Staphylococcus muscae TaxID=1294 RepID=A0A240C814_9STAP|nr:integral membrane protein [Staphylococcus muscae]
MMHEFPRVGFVEAFKLFWTNYVNFKGRSRRSEYWWVALWHMIITVSISLIAVIMIFVPKIGPFIALLLWLLIGLYSLAVLIPNLALLVRRFHDRSMSMLIPILGLVLSIIYNVVYFIGMWDSGILFSPEAVEESSSVFSADSGWFIVAGIVIVILFIVQIITFIITLLDSKKEANQYGPSPKYTEQATQSNNHHDEITTENTALLDKDAKPLTDLDELESQHRKPQDDPYKY